MEPTEIDHQSREADIEAIKQVVATVQHATQNELVEEFLGLLAISEVDEVVRVDHATGDVRRLEGDAEGEAPAGLVAPSTNLSRQDGAAVIAEGVWMPDPTTWRITRTELADGQQTAAIDAPDSVVEELAAGHDALWMVSTDFRRSAYVLEKRDPIDGTVVATATMPAKGGRLTAGPSDMWLSYGTPDGQRLARIDPDTMNTLDTFEVDLELPPSEVTASEDRVWFISSHGLTSIEPTTGEQHDLELPSVPRGMTADEHGVWVTHPRESVARRIEGDDVVRTVDVPAPWQHVAATDDGALWLTGRQLDDRAGDSGNGHAIVRLDATTTSD